MDEEEDEASMEEPPPRRWLEDPPDALDVSLHPPTLHDSLEPKDDNDDDRTGGPDPPWEDLAVVNPQSLPPPPQEEEEEEKAIDTTSLDRAFAMELQEKFNLEQQQQQQQQQQEEDLFQNKTYTEKAFAFTSNIVAQHETMQKETGATRLLSQLSLVNADDVLFFAERLFQYLDETPANNQHLRVQVGYVRYTPPPSRTPDSIRMHIANSDGPFGSGIYVASHPFSFGNAAVTSQDQILMIARLNQWKKDSSDTNTPPANQQPLHGVYLGSTTRSNEAGAFQIAVLDRSSPYVPLVALDTPLLHPEDDHSPGNELVFRYHAMMQTCIDEYFNMNKPKTPLIQVLPSQLRPRGPPSPIPPPPDADGVAEANTSEDIDFALAVAMREKEDPQTTTSPSYHSEPRTYVAGPPANATTVTGRAFSFTSRVVENHDSFLEEYYSQESSKDLCRWFSLVNADDILFFSERLLQYKNDTADAGPVDLGYARYRMPNHQDLDAARTEALPHLQSRNIVTRNGPFGEGIYVANHPFVSSATENEGGGNMGGHRKSDKILIVARLKGPNEESSRSEVLMSGLQFSQVEDNSMDVFEICVIGKSSQCIPLLLFDSRLVDSLDVVQQGHVMVYRYQCLLQGILDEYFNMGRPKTVVTKKVPPILHHRSGPPRTIHSEDPKLQCIISYTAPKNNLVSLPKNGSSHLPYDLLMAPSSNLIVPLFLDATFHRKHRLRNPVDGRRLDSSLNYVSIVPSRQNSSGMDSTKITLAYECGATFDITFNGNDGDETSNQGIWASIFRSPDFLRQLQHRTALHYKKCSTCKKGSCMNEEMVQIGVMPTGAMRVFELQETACPGFTPGTFLISYKIESDVQKDYHENPGVKHHGTSREAYVPNNAEGRALIQRLIYAFAHGMTFRVGVSITTGRPNSVTWASIPHKTSLTYGPFGYPDANYLNSANEQLNILGVPSVFPVFSTER